MEDIIEAYNTHGDEFLIIDFDNLRKYTFAQYIEVNIKKADGNVVAIQYIKMSSDGIKTGCRINNPSTRSYASIRVGIIHDDDNINTRGFKILSNSYMIIMKKYKNLEYITDDDKLPRKTSENLYRPIYLISTKIDSPLQTTKKNSKTNDIEELTNPLYWVSIPRKTFWNGNEIKKDPIHFRDPESDKELFYLDSGKENLSKPMMSYELGPTFLNMDDTYFNPKSGRKVYNTLGHEEENGLNNCNIHNYLTKNSEIIGLCKVQVVVASRNAKLDISLYGKNFVSIGDDVNDEYGDDDDERIEEYLLNKKGISNNSKVNDVSDQLNINHQEIDDQADEDF